MRIDYGCFISPFHIHYAMSNCDYLITELNKHGSIFSLKAVREFIKKDGRDGAGITCGKSVKQSMFGLPQRR